MTKEVDNRSELRDRFIAERGYWNPFWDGLLTLDPGFFESYLQFSTAPWRTGTLEPKIRELIYVAIDASVTHLFESGMRQHMRNALECGATKQEVMEVLELISALGIHSCIVGMPILLEESAKLDAEAGRLDAAAG